MTRREITKKFVAEYSRASKKDKGRILGELCETGEVHQDRSGNRYLYGILGVTDLSITGHPKNSFLGTRY
ncbi:hypothetical protein [Arthrobacter livingstonensis]|uniref:hypothetical protein n=1 Tax=Arthrobacter livingstonensis TaxID=670078 RepID=UPI0011B59265|nr:hypothetical protein [Arthrobacter livingstonensis]